MHRQTPRSPLGRGVGDRTYKKDVVTAFYLRRIGTSQLHWLPQQRNVLRPWLEYSRLTTISTTRGLRHCLFCNQRQCEGLYSRDKQSSRFPRFFFIVLGILKNLWCLGINHKKEHDNGMTMHKRCTILVSICFFLTQMSAFAQKTETTSWYVNGYTEQIAKNYFNNSTLLEPIEGIWQSSDGFKYAIEREIENGHRISGNYRVIVLESSHDGWKLSQIKGFITSGSVESVYSFKYYTRSYNGGNTESQNVFLMVESPIVMTFSRIDGGGKIVMYRIYPKVESTEQGISSSTPQWSGSGIVIGEKYIATNNHVVEGANTLVVNGINGDMNTSYRVQVVAIDKNNDLAIVKIVDEKFKGFGTVPYGFKLTTADVGTEIFVLGYPMTDIMGEEIKVTNGIISAKTGFQGDVSTYQMTAPIQPGNSGGPVFDYNGNLIGISVAHIKNEIAQNVNYAVKLSYLQNLIESSTEPIHLQGTNNISNFNLPDKIKVITPFVVMFKANETQDDNSTSFNCSKPVNNNIRQKAEQLRQRATEKYQNNDFYGAYADIEEAIKIVPSVEAHYLKAAIARRLSFIEHTTQKYIDDAIKSLEYCVENQYQLEYCYCGIGSLYEMQKNYRMAIEYYTKAIGENKRNVFSIFHRGLCKSESGDKSGGIVDYMQAIKYEGLVDYDYGTVYNNIAYSYLCMGNYNQSEKYIKEALNRNHMEWYIWDTFGELAYKVGDYGHCISSMSNAITIDNKNANSYYYRGLAKVKIGNHSGAYGDLQKLETLDSLMADTLRATIDMGMVDFEKILEDEKIIVSPDFTKASSGLSVRAIELTSEYTALYLTWRALLVATGNSYCVDKDAYIVEKESGKKMFLLKTENCPISPQMAQTQNGKAEFVLYFPALKNGCKEIDFYESSVVDGMQGWSIVGIQMKSEKSGKENTVNWEDVIVTDNESAIQGMVYVKTEKETSGWGNAASDLGVKNCLKALQKEAAKNGCTVVLVTNINRGYTTSVTAKMYRMP